MDEAIEWVKRCPNPMDGDSEIEIRQVFEAADFGDEFTPELREQEQRLGRRWPKNERRALACARGSRDALYRTP